MPQRPRQGGRVTPGGGGDFLRFFFILLLYIVSLQEHDICLLSRPLSFVLFVVTNVLKHFLVQKVDLFCSAHIQENYS